MHISANIDMVSRDGPKAIALEDKKRPLDSARDIPLTPVFINRNHAQQQTSLMCLGWDHLSEVHLSPAILCT